MVPTSPSFVQCLVCVSDPPAGISFAIQKGRDALLSPFDLQLNAIWFAFTIRLGSHLPDGSPNFLGEFAHGTPTDRFVYINSGTRAGQAHSCWERRAKLKLAGIPRSLVESVVGRADRAVRAVVVGTGPDGGPTCATVRENSVSWAVTSTASMPIATDFQTQESSFAASVVVRLPSR